MKNKKQIDLEIEDLQKSLNEVISKNHSRSNPRYSELKKQIKFLKQVRRVLYLTCDGKFLSANLLRLEQLILDYDKHYEKLRKQHHSLKLIHKMLLQLNPLFNKSALENNIRILKYILD